MWWRQRVGANLIVLSRIQKAESNVICCNSDFQFQIVISVFFFYRVILHHICNLLSQVTRSVTCSTCIISTQTIPFLQIKTTKPTKIKLCSDQFQKSRALPLPLCKRWNKKAYLTLCSLCETPFSTSLFPLSWKLSIFSGFGNLAMALTKRI